MAIEEPGSHQPRSNTEPTGSLAVLPIRRERLAIVSTRDRLCGIAAYTHALERQLADIFDVTVFDLDQDLLRSRNRRVTELGDRAIKDICGSLARFDAVNLQLEYGTLGQTPGDICRRFAWLIAAAPRLSVTFHTVKRPSTFPITDFLKAIAALKLRRAGDIWGAYRRNHLLSLRIAQILRRAQQRKTVSIIVHNRRDAAEFRHAHGFKRVFEHPLAFLSPAQAQEILSQATRHRFPLLDKLSDDATLIGVFGFINDYKGFGTAIRALYHLPKTHHLLIFGGIHPNEITSQQPIHPYLLSLLDDARVDARPSKNQQRTFAKHQDPRDLSERIHFMGAPEDDDFLTGMAICDAVVFPYLEVGQSASGPISQALELGRRIIASRTHTFLEFAAYHPSSIEFFDIGNHLELAERILARPQYAARREPLRYTVETSKAVYLAASSALDTATPQFRQPGTDPVARRQKAG